MDDKAFVAHLELGHPESTISLWAETGAFSLREFARSGHLERRQWDVYHEYLHRSEVSHTHGPSGSGFSRGTDNGTSREEGTMRTRWVQTTGCTCLDPPKHMADCPGRSGTIILNGSVEGKGLSIIHQLWSELDRLMAALKEGTDADDGGDRFRAQGLAFALAVFINPASPDVQEIRRTAVERWEASREGVEA